MAENTRKGETMRVEMGARGARTVARLTRLAAMALLAWSLAAVPGAARSEEAHTPSAGLPVKGMVNLIDLGAGSCIPCKMMAPILEELKREYAGRAEVHFVDVR